MLDIENYSYFILFIALILLGIHFSGKKIFLNNWKNKYAISAILWFAWFCYEEFYIKPWVKTLPSHDPVIRVDAVLFFPILAFAAIFIIVKWIRRLYFFKN